MYPETTSLLPYLAIVAAYFLGSISTAIITCKAMGLEDPRTVGSNNPGATNVLRIGGKKAAAITLLGDALKGLIPVVIAQSLGWDYTWLILIGLAAFLGHLYPVFYGFKGGKGVATAIGIYLALHLWAGLVVCTIWLIMAKGFKMSSLAALIATLLAPVIFYGFTGHAFLAFGLMVMTILIFIRHKSNIQRILSGEEGNIKLKK